MIVSATADFLHLGPNLTFGILEVNQQTSTHNHGSCNRNSSNSYS